MFRTVVALLYFAASPMLADAVFGNFDFDEPITCQITLDGVTTQGCTVSGAPSVFALGSSNLTVYSRPSFFQYYNNYEYQVSVPFGIDAIVTWGIAFSSAISESVVVTGGSGTGYIDAEQTSISPLDCTPEDPSGSGSATLVWPSSFTFGVPFTVSLDVAISVAGGYFGSLGPGGCGNGATLTYTILDSNNNPVPDAVVSDASDVPEPSSFLPIMTLAGWIISSPIRRRRR